jgi:AraC family transcriptional regulator, transcriptional activator of pobA
LDKVFHIFKIDAVEADKIAAKPDEPHKHNFEELIIVVDGQLEHFIDFDAKIFAAPIISFVTKGKSHRLIPKSVDGKCEIWGIRFKSEFIAESTFHFYSTFHKNATIAFESGYCFNRIVAICQLMYDEYQQKVPNYAILQQLLSLTFTMIEANRANEGDQSNAQHTTFKNFLALLEDNYQRQVGVEFYAEKLFMSTRNLNRICQSTMEQSVSELIETRRLIEAKNQLLHTNKSIADIGFELGYNEKSYFTTVFKKKSGQTPTEFREEMKKLLHS